LSGIVRLFSSFATHYNSDISSREYRVTNARDLDPIRPHLQNEPSTLRPTGQPSLSTGRSAGSVSGGVVSPTMADVEVEVYELVWQPAS
jgi:hypothetical protein